MRRKTPQWLDDVRSSSGYSGDRYSGDINQYWRQGQSGLCPPNAQCGRVLVWALACLCIAGCAGREDAKTASLEDVRRAVLAYLRTYEGKKLRFVEQDFAKPLAGVELVGRRHEFDLRGWHFDRGKGTLSKLYDYGPEAYWCVFTIRNVDTSPEVADLKVTKDTKLWGGTEE